MFFKNRCVKAQSADHVTLGDLFSLTRCVIGQRFEQLTGGRCRFGNTLLCMAVYRKLTFPFSPTTSFLKLAKTNLLFKPAVILPQLRLKLPLRTNHVPPHGIFYHYDSPPRRRSSAARCATPRARHCPEDASSRVLCYSL